MIDATVKRSLASYTKILFNKDFITTLSVRFFLIAVSLVTSIVTTRCLGPAGRGEYYFIVTFANLIAQLANLGMHTSNTYYIVKEKTWAPSLIINSLWISIIVGIFASVLGIFFWMAIEHPDAKQLFNLSIALVLVPTTIFYLLGTNIFIGLNRIRLFNFYQIASSLVIALIIIAMGVLKADATGFLMALTAAWLLICIAIFINLIKIIKIPSFKFNFETFFKGIYYSFKSYIMSLLNMLVLKLNIVLMKYLATAAVVGYYSVAAQINDTLVVLPLTLCMLLFPKMVANETSRWEQMKSNLWVTAGVMGFACAVIWFIALPAITWIFGAKFAPSAEILRYMLPAAFFYSLVSVVLTYISAIGIPKIQIFNWLLGLVVYLACNLVLIPQQGAIGAAISLSVTYLFIFVTILITAKKHSKGATYEKFRA